MVTGNKYDTAALPKHQAVMALEYCDQEHCEKSSKKNRYCFAINTGADGDLGDNWKMLSAKHCPVGMHSCPSLNYDATDGYYYMTGGGSHINGPDRSKDLIHWERSPLHPMSKAATDMSAPVDGFISKYYKELWKAVPEGTASYLSAKAMKKWNWGNSDADLCCNDGSSPSYITYISSKQSHPAGFQDDASSAHPPAYLGLGQYKGSLNDWLRSCKRDPQTP